jgi:hypothetical protein
LNHQDTKFTKVAQRIPFVFVQPCGKTTQRFRQIMVSSEFHGMNANCLLGVLGALVVKMAGAGTQAL